MTLVWFANKTVMVVPKSLIGQTASEFLRLYLSANILVATERDFEKSRRKQFISRIATGDYDCIIMSHSQFEKIPISPERKARMIDQQIDELWEWQKNVYQNLELHLDATIDKVDNLAKDVELQRMEKKWDELYEQTHQESETASIQFQPVALVSEKEYEYGADAFGIYMKENKGKIKPKMKEVAVQKNEKAR